MKKTTIRKHLTPYSIYHKRKTTINHAFASALAPCDDYNEEKLIEALAVLELSPDDLNCVYCGREAYTWDHLVGLVEDGELRGFGHQIGNLVPCCRECNSRKGSRSWEDFLQTEIPDSQIRAKLAEKLATYNGMYAKHIDLKRVKQKLPSEWARYVELKHEIFKLMKEADELAHKLRHEIRM